MVNVWSEASLLTLLSNYDLKDIYNADEFRLFYSCLPNKIYQLKSEKNYGKKLKKYVLLEWQQQMLWVISYPGSSLGRPRIHDASKMSSFYLVTTEINGKVGWMGNSLKSDSESWTGSLLLKEGIFLL